MEKILLVVLSWKDRNFYAFHWNSQKLTGKSVLREGQERKKTKKTRQDNLLLPFSALFDEMCCFLFLPLLQQNCSKLVEF